MEEAEEWARGNGYREVRLRSGLHRNETHQFYQALRYGLATTIHMFRKELNPDPYP